MADKPEKPPVTAPIPGAVTLSPEEQAALRQTGLIPKLVSTNEPPYPPLRDPLTGHGDSTRPTFSGGGGMPPDNAKDTFDGSTRALFAAIGAALLATGLRIIFEQGGSVPLGIVLACSGALFFYAALIKTHAQRVLSNDQIKELNLIAKQPKWWLAILGVFCFAVIFSPFIEQHRWPFSTVIHDPPTSEDIERTAAPIRDDLAKMTKDRNNLFEQLSIALQKPATPPAEVIAKATAPIQKQLDDMTRQRDAAIANAQALQHQLDIARQQPNTPPSSPAESKLSAEDIAAKIEIWRNVSRLMNNLSISLSQGYLLTDMWTDEIKSDRAKILTNIDCFRKSIQQVKNELESLRVSYLNYDDVSKALDEVRFVRSPIPVTVFDKVLFSLGGFEQAIRTLPESLPPNYESAVRVHSAALRRDLNAVRDWQSSLRTTASLKDTELLNMGSK